MRVCAHGYVCASTYTCAGARVGQKSASNAVPPPTLWRQGLSLGLGGPQVGVTWMASEPQRSTCLHLPSPGVLCTRDNTFQGFVCVCCAGD